MAKLNSGTRIYGTATVDSTLAVTGATTLSSTLAVGATTITGAATVSTTLGVTGATTLSSTLDVTGIASFAAGSAALPSITRTGDLNTGFWFPAADTIAVSTGGTERMRISPTYGNMLIGATSQGYASLGYMLGIQSGGDQTFLSIAKSGQTLDAGGMIIGIDGTGGAIDVRPNQPLDFYTNDTQRVRFAANGNVGIGTTSPVAKLQIKGSGTSGQVTASFILENSSSGTAGMDITGSAGASRLRFLYGGGPSTGTNALTEGMCLLTEGANAGFVGIGTTSPYNNLEVAAATDSVIYINGTSLTQGNRAALFMGARNVNGNHGGVSIEAISVNNQQNDMVFRTGATTINTFGTERMRLTTAGLLAVSTSGGTYGETIAARSGSTYVLGLYRTGTGSEGQIVFSNGNGAVGSVFTNASATAYNTSSDYRLKNTIAPITGALAKVALLKPYTYKWNIDNSNGEGFIAHELAEVCPHAVTGEKDAVNEDGSIKPQGVDTSFLVATLTAAIQEQQVLIQDQKVLIQSLITRLTALEAR